MKQEREQRKKKNHGFFVGFFIAAILYAVFLELDRNTIAGWIAAAGVFALFYFLWTRKIAYSRRLFQAFSWIGFFGALAVVCVLSYPPEKLTPATDDPDSKATDVVTVAQGKLTGVTCEDGEVEVYAGIPYAKAPVGKLRWKEPQEPDSWSGVRVCDHFAPMSMQKSMPAFLETIEQIYCYRNFRVSLKENYREKRSEDSLYLNVWKPAGDVKNAPVLVFIHGGSLQSGQSDWYAYSGRTLAKRGIVVVTITYRLGVFGYYADEDLVAESGHHTTGNYGLLDQIQALKWLQENIASFGGDPGNVTIAGESAGSSAVNALCVSPLSRGLFRRAIAESSGIVPKVPFHTFRSLDDALSVGKSIRKEFSADSMDDLRKVPAEELVKTTHANTAMCVDGYAITKQPYESYAAGENHEEALLNGYNAEEARLFTLFMGNIDVSDFSSLIQKLYSNDEETVSAVEELYPVTDPTAKDTFRRILGASYFGYSHNLWSRLLAAEGRPVYEYYFSKTNRGLSDNHGGEEVYAYGTMDHEPWLYDKEDEALSHDMQSYWVNFCRTGDPNDSGNAGDAESLPYWQEFSKDPSKVMNLGSSERMIEDPNLALYSVIDRYMDRAVR